MLRTLRLALLALVSVAGPSQASGFTEKGLSLLSFQLCNYSVTRTIQKVEAVQTSHVTHAPCGGWIPWRRCPKTVYRTQYLAVEVPVSRNVTDCCAGYEQLGLYCVLPLNRSREFASRPGVCPEVGSEAPVSPCMLDTDCSGLRKCCPSSRGHHCVAPAPRAPERNPVTFWYNVTVLVKMDFKVLKEVDPRLLDHMRLLHSMVTSALQPLRPAVHPVQSASGDAATTVSWLLLGLPRLVPVATVSVMLDEVVKRVYEVINIQVQDVGECFLDDLSACSGGEQCLHMEGSSQCTCHPELPASTPQKLNRTCGDCPPIRDYVTLNVTSSSFRVSWRLNSSRLRTFHVQVYKGEELLQSASTTGRTLEVAGLEAGELYGVKTSYQACGSNVTATLTVRTDARVFGVTIRVLDHNVTEELLNPSSPEYQDFSRLLLREVANAFPPALSALYRRGKLKVRVVSLQAGSVVVTLRLLLQDPEFPVGLSTLAPMLPPLWASRVFQIDPRGTRVQDWDECADSLGHDCSPAAQCINLEGSYTCRCRTARDANPSRAGRACEGDTVSPTGGVLAPATGVTAPVLGTETAALDRETPALWPSAGHPWGTPAAGQAQTPGLPPRRGGSDVAKQDGNGTGQGMEEEVNSSTEPPVWPTPTEGPADHIEWHASLPTWRTPPAPLDPTGPQNMHPGPSSSLDLPSALTPESLKLPACDPVPIERVTVSNVTSTSFHVAWAADLARHPTFQLTVTSTRSPAVHLETRNVSLTLSGLEPGVLHLVEIAAGACGEGGAGARLRVRTAAQKLRGKVRIANVRYVESFGNASSEEYQDFREQFLTMVRGSLPAAMLRLLDSGGVQVEVTRITNGSVVVEFNLLITADVGVREVSAAFLVAFQNASLLEVVGEDTVIQDYDECESQEHDCEPGASCRNTLGSFTCSCVGGTPHVPLEYSGRPCEGDPPGHAAQAPGAPGGLPTPAGTRAASVPAASQGPQDPPPRLSLTEAVRVLCEIEKVAIAIQRRFLRQESIPESSLYLGHPSCNVSYHNSTHVLLVAGWSECGTVVQSNVTNTVVRTMLRNDLSPEGIIHHLKILSPIHCAFQNDLLTSSGYTPEWGVYTIIEDLHGAGNFVTEMQLFIGDSPIPRNYSVSASDDVKIEVGLYKQKSNLKVVLTECWATPSSNARDPVTFGFINNSCPIPNTHTNVIENGDSSKAQFKLKIFSFINNSIVYLHCRLRICMDSPGTTCKINCDGIRSPRSGEASATHQTSWGPLIRSEGEHPGAQAGLAAGYLVLIAVAVFASVAGAAALVIVQYQRMTGKYDFRARPDDFSYQVFSE
ncbi:LOW QUALITY PROTEIN: uromodulin-like 1 [Vulpes lagopus]|uniref:LOW QUALITY PROTEIN: uromodulin-like 1 n=1 Tax=Vulpes lagopus TaxID=494514 RepID=UPI001BC99EE7|nr:LOW QUALITY PROTEIN: uromodulin-like 1 [Vulpes lagopus]